MSEMSITQEEAKYKGVGGWLLILCLTLTFFSPMGTVYNFVAGYGAVSVYLDRMPGFNTLIAMDGVICFGWMILSIYAGYCLWMIKPNAVSTAKKCLGVFLFFSIGETLIVFLADIPKEATAFLFGFTLISAIRVLIFTLIWNAYLSRSKRVKATYGL